MTVHRCHSKAPQELQWTLPRDLITTHFSQANVLLHQLKAVTEIIVQFPSGMKSRGQVPALTTSKLLRFYRTPTVLSTSRTPLHRQSQGTSKKDMVKNNRRHPNQNGRFFNCSRIRRWNIMHSIPFHRTEGDDGHNEEFFQCNRQDRFPTPYRRRVHFWIIWRNQLRRH